MATIRSAIQLQDGMTPALRSISNALNMTISSFEALQRASSSSIDTATLSAARHELASAEIAMNQVEQEIREANNAQQQFNDSVRGGGDAMNGLIGKVRSLASAYLGIKAVQTGMDATDAYISRQARLGLIVEVDDTAVDAAQQKIEATAQLQNEIFAAAQRSRGEYGAMVDNVAKLGLLAGDFFNDTSEIVAFTETMQKAFKVSGASPMEATSAMYQLNQAMASGRLQGDEYRSIIENAPMLANALADYCGVTRGELKDLSSDGVLTADVIKGAVFNMAKELETQFEQMPMTFGDAWISIKNIATNRAQEVMQTVNHHLNSGIGQSVIQGINNSIGVLIHTLGIAITMVMYVASFFVDNWSIIEPVIWGIVGALVVYNATMGVAWLTTLKNVALSTAHAVATSAQTASTIAFTLATQGLNAALAMCPISWIIIAVVALIAIFYAAVAAVNKFADTSLSATGMIAGAFAVLAAYKVNRYVIPVWNTIAAFVNFFGNVWHDPVAAVKVLFYDMCLTVIGYITSMAHGIEDVINKIPGVTIDITSGLDRFQDQIEGASQKVKSESQWKEYVKKLDYIDYGDAYRVGDKFGRGIEDKVSSMFQFNMPEMDDIKSKMPDYSNAMENLGEGVGDTAKNTGRTADKLEATEEDLKYLRDLAEQEVINRFTTAKISLEMTNNNHINSELDIDGIVDAVGEKLYEAMEVAAEGVH